jgi:hypothetical protein
MEILEQEEKSLFVDVTSQKIYTLRSIQVATFLGGPIIAGYLISENYRAFNEDKKSKIAIMLGVLATIVLFGVVFMLPDTKKVPTYIIPLAYSWGAYILVQQLMGAQMKAHFAAGGGVYTIWRALLAALIGGTVTVAGVFVTLLLVG